MIISSFCFCLVPAGQVPESFNYQTIVHKASGEVLSSKMVSLKFSILPDIEYDTVVYSERHNVLTDKFGFVSVTIGKGTDKTGSFSEINFCSAARMLSAS